MSSHEALEKGVVAHSMQKNSKNFGWYTYCQYIVLDVCHQENDFFRGVFLSHGIPSSQIIKWITETQAYVFLNNGIQQMYTRVEELQCAYRLNRKRHCNYETRYFRDSGSFISLAHSLYNLALHGISQILFSICSHHADQ